MRDGILTLLGFLSVVVLAGLIQRTNPIDSREHDSHLQAILGLRELSTDLVNAVDDAREGKLYKEAEIDAAFTQVAALFPQVRAVPDFVRARTADSLETLLRGFEDATEERKRLVLEFNRVNVPLHLALDSLDADIDQTAEAVWQLEGSSRAALGVHEHASYWLEEARDGGNRSRRAMASAVVELQKQAAGLSPRARREVEDLLASLARASVEAALADSLSDAIDDAPGSDNSVSIRELYEAAFELAAAGGMRARGWLALYATLLLSLVLVAVYRLQRSRIALNEAKDALEVKVRERTAELEEANRELARAHDEALQASVAKSQFLANMSHELRTPLNSVIGFTSILLKNKRGTLVAQELGFLTRILENGRHLLSLINDVLDLSKIEAGKIELDLCPVRVDELVLETVRQLGSHPKANTVSLRAVVPAAVPSVVADAGRLKQILINLVGNALKFTEQGSVTVALRLDSGSGHADRIEIIDTGIGVPQDRLGAIFEAFQQADASTTRRFGGTGLGLAISSSLAQLMGCRIEVTSVVGEGSVFTIVLPTAVASPAEQAPTTVSMTFESRVATMPGRELLLAIDDDADSRLLMTQLLEEAGFEVLTANSGAQGLRMAREFRPRAILLDLMMPGMSGFEVLRALKHDPDLNGTPVIVVSMAARDHSSSLLGVVDLVEKPLARATLLAAIQRNAQLPVRRVLLVDDDGDTRSLISNYLSADDVVVETAANGFEALSVMSRFAPDAAIIDLMMPGMDGSECIRTIRQDARYRHLPILVITSKELSSEELGKLKSLATVVLKKGEELERDLRLTLEFCLRKPTPSEGLVVCAA